MNAHDMHEPASQEFLNAFLDGELAEDERERALARLEGDADFKARVCEARTLKEMVAGAYAELPTTGQAAAGRHGHRAAWRHGLAAGLLLLLGLGGGWLARDWQETPEVVDRLAGLPEGYRPVALTTQVDPDKVVLHLDSSEPTRLAAVLDLAERMLAERGAQGRVEVVVNSYGLNLLRQEVSPEGERIRRLAGRHANLSFVACGQTVARLGREGVKVVLLPEAEVAPSAIGEILTRMQQGWVYVKV
jgi:hypothetical protein